MHVLHKILIYNDFLTLNLGFFALTYNAVLIVREINVNESFIAIVL